QGSIIHAPARGAGKMVPNMLDTVHTGSIVLPLSAFASLDAPIRGLTDCKRAYILRAVNIRDRRMGRHTVVTAQVPIGDRCCLQMPRILRKEPMPPVVGGQPKLACTRFG